MKKILVLFLPVLMTAGFLFSPAAMSYTDEQYIADITPYLLKSAGKVDQLAPKAVKLCKERGYQTAQECIAGLKNDPGIKSVSCNCHGWAGSRGKTKLGILCVPCS
ncbi:MAG: hypothetical protein A3F10_06135 [Coxiella sp. RIFCSPHIGHO2_12_FULL_42_15]|nr:MAG: hypothetical protein A3F10_06135 [Coxiella sp. RIFCSPHIGHO2_12_FULL_42_15]